MLEPVFSEAALVVLKQTHRQCRFAKHWLELGVFYEYLGAT